MMNCISYVSSAALFSHGRHVIMRNSLYGFSSTSWKSGIRHAGIKVLKLDFALTGFRVQCFSARGSQTLRLPKVKPQPSMEEESNAFYVVRKGDVIGVYNSLSDCQAQVSSLVSDPSVSVYKGYSLRKETEEYLASRGLKNALYSMNAVDLKDDLFGTLTPCPFRQPDGLASLVDKTPKKMSSQKRSKVMLNNSDTVRCTSTEQANKHLELGHSNEAQPISRNYVQDLWQTKNQNLANLCKEVKELKDMFLSFKIGHVKREFNSDADAQANLAINLPTGKVCEDSGELFDLPIGKVCKEPDELY